MREGGGRREEGGVLRAYHKRAFACGGAAEAYGGAIFLLALRHTPVVPAQLLPVLDALGSVLGDGQLAAH